jgi:hypothetical protein
MSVFNGKHVTLDYGDLELTEELREALYALDADCAYGCGGTWEIFEEEPENGVPFRAVFVDIATDELVWDSEAGTWTDGYSDDEDDDEDEEDEEEEDLAG